MTRKTVVIIEIIAVCLAVILISIFGLRPEVWRDKIETEHIVLIFDTSDENFSFNQNENKLTVKLNEKVDFFLIEFEVLPKNATNKEIRFTSNEGNDKIVNIADNGMVTFVKKQNVTIHMETTDGTGVKASIEFRFVTTGGDGGHTEL